MSIKLDQSQRFLFEGQAIRGQYVSLDQSWQKIAQQADLEGRGLHLLGEALAAVVLLVDTLKIDGSVTLQIRGDGPLELLVVEANSHNKVRGIARQSGVIKDQMDLSHIFGAGHLVITIKTEGGEPHQGIAPLHGMTLSQAFEHYFSTSEQLSTNFWLACDSHNVSGLLIQKLPGKSTDADAWERVLHLASTVTNKELQQLSLDDLLYRLFHEETLRLFEASDIEFSCSCSRERTAGMLLTLGIDEVNDILDQEGEVAVSCEFCNANYRFDPVDITQVFSQASASSPTVTTH